MKYVNQLDYPDMPYITKTEMEGEDYEKGQKTTIRSSGCGLCAAIMVADRLLPDCDFDLEQARQLSYDTKANYRSGTSYVRFAPAFAQKLGLAYEPTNDLERLRYCLRTGGAAVAHVGGDREGFIGLFTHGRHYIAIIGEEPDGRFAILDPSYKEGKFDEEGRKGKIEMKCGVIALCDGDTLEENGVLNKTHYHLFWRA